MRQVNLPWYDFSFNSEDHSYFWLRLREILRREGVDDLPSSLNKTSHVDSLLLDPNLLLSQTCGYDIATGLPGRLQILLTPIYSVSGCGRGTYSSWIVNREDDFLNSDRNSDRLRLVANDQRSWSGYHCLNAIGYNYSSVQWSGSHLESLRQLKRHKADVAAIDCIVWEWLRLHRPLELIGLQVVGQTAEVPAPPLVTRAAASKHEISALRSALLLMTQEQPEICRRLKLIGFEFIHPKTYKDKLKLNHVSNSVYS